jgi:hypothetical protein
LRRAAARVTLLFGLVCSVIPCAGQTGAPKLPGSHNSARLEKLFRQVADSTGFQISFDTLASDSDYAGLTDFIDDKIYIKIREGLTPEVRESVIAHELFHAQLRIEGFPTTFLRGLDPFFERLSLTILDCVSHQVIDPRMKAAGFKPEILWQLKVEGIKKQLFTVDPRNIGFQRLNGLEVFCLSQHADAGSIKEVENALNKVQPAIVEYAHSLRSRFGRRTCDDPKTCFELAKELRDTIGFTQIKLGNPKTRLAE